MASPAQAALDSMVTGDQLVAEARGWLGVPYRHQGHSRVGIDCWGLVRVVLAKHRLLPPDFKVPDRYGNHPDRLTVSNVERFATKIPTPLQGCLILITWPRYPYPTHLGFYADGNLIHANGRDGRVVEHGYRAPWTRMTYGLFAVPGVAHV